MLDVLTTPATPCKIFTVLSQPNASACAESSPMIIAERCASNKTPAVIHVSLVKVRTIVLPPATISASVAVVIVPLRVTLAPATLSSFRGLSTSVLVPRTPPVSNLRLSGVLTKPDMVTSLKIVLIAGYAALVVTMRPV